MSITKDLDALQVSPHDPVRAIAKSFDQALKERYTVTLTLAVTGALLLGGFAGVFATYSLLKKDTVIGPASLLKPTQQSVETAPPLLPTVPDGEIMIRDGKIQAMQVTKGEWSIVDGGGYVVLLHSKTASTQAQATDAKKTAPVEKNVPANGSEKTATPP